MYITKLWDVAHKTVLLKTHLSYLVSNDAVLEPRLKAPLSHFLALALKIQASAFRVALTYVTQAGKAR